MRASFRKAFEDRNLSVGGRWPVSGRGSTLENSERLRAALPGLLRRHAVKTFVVAPRRGLVVDAACRPRRRGVCGRGHFVPDRRGEQAEPDRPRPDRPASRHHLGPVAGGRSSDVPRLAGPSQNMAAVGVRRQFRRRRYRLSADLGRADRAQPRPAQERRVCRVNSEAGALQLPRAAGDRAGDRGRSDAGADGPAQAGPPEPRLLPLAARPGGRARRAGDA